MMDWSTWLQHRVSWGRGNKRGREKNARVGLSTHGLDDLGPMIQGRLTHAFIHLSAIRHRKCVPDL
jgi:hypothetical protein